MIALQIDEPPETGWSVMPGFDQDIPIPTELEPPRPDADETLPNMLHPSYPFGRPVTLGRGKVGAMSGVGNLLGTVGMVGRDPGAADWAGRGGGGRGGGGKWGEEMWKELGLELVLEKSMKKEVPPGMAVS